MSRAPRTAGAAVISRRGVQRLRGGHGDVIVCLDPNATTDFHRFSMQAVFTSPQEHQIVPQFNGGDVMFTVALPLREVI